MPRTWLAWTSGVPSVSKLAPTSVKGFSYLQPAAGRRCLWHGRLVSTHAIESMRGMKNREGMTTSLGAVPVPVVVEERAAQDARCRPVLRTVTVRDVQARTRHGDRRIGRRADAHGIDAEMRRHLLVALGCACVVLGVIGVVVPILPTTPLLLAAAYCFARSSERFHAWLLGNRLFGRYLRSYLDGRGLPLHAKLFTVALLWASIFVSALLLVDSTVARILLLAIGVTVTAHIALIRAKTAAAAEPERPPATQPRSSSADHAGHQGEH